MEITEGLFRPDVKPAFVREARGKFGDDKSRRHKENNRRDDPQTDRGLPVVRCGRYPARAKDSGDIKKQHIPETHHASKFGDGAWRCRGRLAHSFTLMRGETGLPASRGHIQLGDEFVQEPEIS